MALYRVHEDSLPRLLRLPESGMGFQVVRAGTISGTERCWLVLSATRALAIGRNEGAERWLTTRGAYDWFTDFASGQATETTRLINPELLIYRTEVGKTYVSGDAVQLALPVRSALVKKTRTKAGDWFFRFSASREDLRVDQRTGAWSPGTYGTTRTDRPLSPSGFAAVGRYALPNDQPASHVYAISPPAGTPIHIGTVAPAYGQAGGGVEIFFPEGAAHAGEVVARSELPDE
ncbi:MAG: hypothetical protein U0704_03635 [Candidatus Eisenbacteria bacterium]